MSKTTDEFEVVYVDDGQVGFVPQAADVLWIEGNHLTLHRNGMSFVLVENDEQEAREMWDALYPRIEAANAH